MITYDVTVSKAIKITLFVRQKVQYLHQKYMYGHKNLQVGRPGPNLKNHQEMIKSKAYYFHCVKNNRKQR